MKTIGESMKQARESHGLTQKELAELSGVYRSAISEYECGTRFPGALILWSIADALDIGIDTLVGRRDCDNETPIWNRERNQTMGQP